MRRGLRHPTRPAASSGGDEPLSVTELTRRIKALLETSIAAVSVSGEISGLKESPSGHVYLSLKDENALVDAVIWRSSAMKMRDLPRDGEQVTARGKLTVYEPRGRYQLVITSFQAAGKGDLWRKFEELKEKLAAEGLFDAERKVSLPAAPRVLGIVTSPTGAALQDMLKIIRRRAPGLRVVVAPCLVQGREAAGEIAAALDSLDRWGGADIIIVGRGGGSLEDLWPFNEEIVARAIARAKTPVVSAVGHETDFTIADFVADARAATPSEAAERVAPDQAWQRGRVAHAALVLSRALAGQTRELRQRLLGLARAAAFRRPRDMFMPKWQRLDETLSDLGSGMERKLTVADNRLRLLQARMDGLSPFAILARGYAIVTDAGGKPVVDAEKVALGSVVAARLHRGGLTAEVRSISPAEESGRPAE